MFRGIKRNTTDSLFSDIVRIRAKWQCERCLRDFSNQRHIFDVAHFITRGNKRLRWDFENSAALCRGCHQYFDMNHDDHVDFMIKKLGPKKYQALRLRKERKLNDFAVDEKLIRQGLKIELARLKQSENILGSR
jgi:5-methylcytosine-specific restriction endonuclease McrA